MIDVSGSMGSSNRFDYAKMAASWIINTLSETDYAMVVAFSSQASSETTHLLQYGRAELAAQSLVLCACYLYLWIATHRYCIVLMLAS